MSDQPLPEAFRTIDVQLGDVEAPDAPPQVMLAFVGIPAMVTADNAPTKTYMTFLDADTAIKVGEALAEAGREKAAEPGPAAKVPVYGAADLAAATAATEATAKLRG